MVPLFQKEEHGPLDFINNLTRVLCLKILFANVSRLVVEQPVRVSLPGYAAEEHPKSC